MTHPERRHGLLGLPLLVEGEQGAEEHDEDEHDRDPVQPPHHDGR